MVRTKKRKKPETLEDLIDAMYMNREEQRDLESQINELKRAYGEFEERLIEKMDAEGMDQARSSLATASLKEPAVRARVDDPARFKKWIRKMWAEDKDKLYLLETRISVTAYREEMKSRKTEIPGIFSYKQRKIGLLNRS